MDAKLTVGNTLPPISSGAHRYLKGHVKTPMQWLP